MLWMRDVRYPVPRPRRLTSTHTDRATPAYGQSTSRAVSPQFFQDDAYKLKNDQILHPFAMDFHAFFPSGADRLRCVLRSPTTRRESPEILRGTVMVRPCSRSISICRVLACSTNQHPMCWHTCPTRPDSTTRCSRNASGLSRTSLIRVARLARYGFAHLLHFSRIASDYQDQE